MKSSLKTALLALSGTVLIASHAMGAISLESGSLAVVFYQVTPGAGGGTVGPNTYVFDLGQAIGYRENTGYNVSVSTISGGPASNNILADLNAAFTSWKDTGTIRWMVVGNVGQTDPAVGGDNSRTSYYSVARDDFNVGTTVPVLSTTADRTGLSNSIESFLNSAATVTEGVNATAGNNAAGEIINKSVINSAEDWLPPTVLTYFGSSINPYQTLANGTIANGPDGLVLEGALDIYRIVHTTGGADPSAGWSQTDAAVGVGQYIGTLTLDGAGNLNLVPEPSAALLGVLGAAGACFRRRRNA